MHAIVTKNILFIYISLILTRFIPFLTCWLFLFNQRVNRLISVLHWSKFGYDVHAWWRYIEKTHLFADHLKRSIEFVCILFKNHERNIFYHQNAWNTVYIHSRQLNFKYSKRSATLAFLIWTFKCREWITIMSHSMQW